MDINRLKRTKMICTIGPVTDSRDALEKLVHIGMNGARLNFSHGSYEEFTRIINDLRDISKLHKRPIAVIQDLQGPKMRVGEINGMLEVQQDSLAIISVNPYESDRTPVIPIQFNFIPYLQIGHSIFFNDGYVKAKVEEVSEGFAKIRFLNEGTIESNKGINIPDTIIANDNFTEKDLQDLDFGISKDVDYIALSFVHTAENVRRIKNLIKEKGGHAKVIAKIETKPAIEGIEGIIDEADAVMIARGDLAVEIGLENVPVEQARIISLCKERHTPVIVATQMLESMIANPRPTRAEVNDVAAATMQEADAVMLSGESAIGKYPFNTVEMMRRIIRATEHTIVHTARTIDISKAKRNLTNAESVSYAAAAIANHMTYDFLAVATATGTSACILSSLRPVKTIVAIAQTEKVYNQMAIVWGVRSFWIKNEIVSIDDLIDASTDILKERGFLENISKIVFMTGMHVGIEGETNSLRIIDTEKLKKIR